MQCSVPSIILVLLHLESDQSTAFPESTSISTFQTVIVSPRSIWSDELLFLLSLWSFATKDNYIPLLFSSQAGLHFDTHNQHKLVHYARWIWTMYFAFSFKTTTQTPAFKAGWSSPFRHLKPRIRYTTYVITPPQSDLFSGATSPQSKTLRVRTLESQQRTCMKFQGSICAYPRTIPGTPITLIPFVHLIVAKALQANCGCACQILCNLPRTRAMITMEFWKMPITRNCARFVNNGTTSVCWSVSSYGWMRWLSMTSVHLPKRRMRITIDSSLE